MENEETKDCVEKVEVDFQYLPKLNYAMLHNGVSLVYKFSLENKGEDDLKNLEIKFTPSDAFAESFTVALELLPKGQSVDLSGFPIKPNANFILQLTESVDTEFAISISVEGRSFLERTFPLTLLTFNEWPGVNVLPQLTASFVTPNSPSLTPVMTRAALILKGWCGDGSLEGYQSKDPNRVRMMAAAVFQAVCELHIIYSNPPASFENTGQRIRLADEVQTTLFGTCIDLALFYASCLESIGLNPLIVMIKGHAFAGVWLVSDMLPTACCDDLALILKHLELNDIAFVENTLMCDGQNADFDEANSRAKLHFNNGDDFECVADVARCRISGIRPLPQRIENNGLWTVESRTEEMNDTEEPLKVNRWDIQSEDKAPELTKQNIWERKLLDLSLRNSLLNFRFTKKSPILLTTSLGKFEDEVQCGYDFEVVPAEKDMDVSTDKAPFYIPFGENTPIHHLVTSSLQNKRIYCTLGEADTKDQLKTIYRAAKLSLEENGANSLYLAVGMLEWNEPKVGVPHFAPILLIPMEMVRRGSGYAIRTRGEDTLLNVTLIELLRQNFNITVPGLDPLPTDESGVDVDLVLASFRQAVMKMAGWNVHNMALLGNFSFSKFILWNDIHSNLDALKQNKIVNSLVEGKLDFEVEPDTTTARELDHNVSPSQLALPVPVDASQLQAVYAAASGKSFILHGPPGTGKSQTITNIIANALFQGKRVLFAAEKMAALEVVQARLEKIGLGPFCLELHSNKAKKSDVLAKLQASSEVTKVKSPADFQTEADKLFDLRQKLNAYVDALHQPSFCGVTLYEAITRFCSLDAEGAEVLSVPMEVLTATTADQLTAWNTAVEELQVVGESCGNPATHPLRFLSFNEFTPALAQNLKELTARGEGLLRQLDELFRNSDFSLATGTMQQFEASVQLCTQLAELKVSTAIVEQPDIEGNNTQIISLLDRGAVLHGYCEQLFPTYKDEVFSLPAEELKLEWTGAENKNFIARWWTRRGIKSQLQQQARKAVADPLADLDLLIKAQAEKRVLDAHKSSFKTFALEDDNVLHISNWSYLKEQQQQMYAIHKCLATLYPGVEQLRAAKKKLSGMLAEGVGYYNAQIAPKYAQVAEAAGKLADVDERLRKEFGMEAGAVADASAPYFAGRVAALQEVAANLNLLPDRYNYLIARRKLAGLGMDFLLQRIEQAPEVTVGEWKNLFRRSFYKALAEYLFAQDQNLVLFKGSMFEGNIKRFRDINAQYQELVKAEIYARLAAKHPDFTIEASSSSEVGVLQKNLRNRGRGTSLRALFDQIPNMLSRLTPCMLMSPMSIAQYLDVKKQPKFDLVIFDEASQMPTSEAIGAIARGENVIVVGDPKQMPPTSFFGTSTDDEENPDLNDLESILEDCLALSIPSSHLQYHYRSKHESLISFSNSQYYDSKLVTFPSPDNRVSKVTLVKVDGHYDKGKSRQNKAEAKAVVDEVVSILGNAELSKRSVGIVTFSSTQQSLIDDMLTDLFAKNPQLEAVANSTGEPLFVKNLENVQGDERDIILFSVGYGPDESGHVSMNFGPLNQTGGERRLNVAVSRARYEMKVFSTLTADMIDLNRTGAEGVRGLKEFLAFAQRGTRTLTQGDMATIRNYESLADVIAAELRKQGYEVDTKVGSSSFRIDVAVVDPADKGRYLLGILCDGDSYFNSQTARDREISQPGILHMLGWKLVKVWSVDWWNNKQNVIQIIANAVEEAKNGTIRNVEAKTVQAVRLEAAEPGAEASEAGGVAKTDYKVCEITSEANPDGLYDAARTGQIVEQMRAILQAEAPVTENYLQHRIATAWGVTRLTSRADARMKELLRLAALHTVANAKQTVVWNTAEEADSFACFRTPSDRDSVDIPVDEFACVMRYIVARQVALPADDLKKQASLQMGFARMGTQLDGLLTEALSQLRQKGLLVDDGGRLRLA